MTDHQKQAIKRGPIHWHADGCEEVCTQAREQLVTNAYQQARAAVELGQATQEQERVLEAHEEALGTIMRLGQDARGYLVWAYMALPSIERAVEAGAWNVEAAVDFFTTEYV